MHLSEQILEAVKDRLMLMSYVGRHVFRSRPEELQIEEFPAITIYQGSDETLLDKKHIKYYDCTLSVYVTLHVKFEHWQYTESTINKIRAEISRRLHADYTLGLPFIIEMQERGTDKPELLSNAENQLAKATMLFNYQYRRLRNDAEKSHVSA